MERTIPLTSTEPVVQKFKGTIFEKLEDALTFLRSLESKGSKPKATVVFLSEGQSALARVLASEQKDVIVVVLNGKPPVAGVPVVVHKRLMNHNNLGEIVTLR